MQTAIQMQSNNKLTIDKSAYFDVEKKQLKYQSEVYGDAETMEEAYTDVEWLQICQIEMIANHNDKLTQEWYKEQYEETRKKLQK